MGAPGVSQLAIELLEHPPAVVHAGQRVVVSEMLEAKLELFALGDVGCC
jgi:hypothetical protein